jgi:hypothetical protein
VYAIALHRQERLRKPSLARVPRPRIVTEMRRTP